MLKNKEVKKLLVFECCLFFLCLGIGFGFFSVIDSKYKREFIKNDGYIISAILKKHPELEEDIIESILSGSGNYEEGQAILSKYGLDNHGTLDYIQNFYYLGMQIKIEMLLLISGIFLLLSCSYLFFLKRHYRRIRDLGTYMDLVLNDNYYLDFQSYDEGDLSSLKNDVYKLTVKLKEGRDLSISDKRELEQTLSDISHQIKTPLTSMYVINDLLRKGNLKEEQKQEFLDKNKVQLKRIEWLVTSLLKMSRLDSGSVQLKLKKENIRKVIENALESLQIPMELKNINVLFEGDSDVCVLMDEHWTVEVFVNILKNAYEHTNEGGTIIITIKNNPIYTEVSIHDNGCGIKKEELSHIFERFYTGSHNKESIGIGLNMAKKVMEKQNGEIYATSIEGEGTTFFIKFMN